MSRAITIQIGNSDDKLTQKEWSNFVRDVADAIDRSAVVIHFFGAAPNYERWQNAAWVVAPDSRTPRPAKEIATLKERIARIRQLYRQDSVAWTDGETELV